MKEVTVTLTIDEDVLNQVLRREDVVTRFSIRGRGLKDEWTTYRDEIESVLLQIVDQSWNQ